VNSKAQPSMPVVVGFSCSREFAPTIEEGIIGKYRIARSGEELLLSFIDQWKEGQDHSNPVEESRYFLAWLSLALRARIEYRATKINNVDVDIQGPPKYKEFVNKIDALPSDLEDLHKRLLSLDETLIRQYIRSCLAYQSAVSMLENLPTLAFFLFVVAIECLSNTVIRGGKEQGFVRFIRTYVPTEIAIGKNDEELFTCLLHQAYRYRSGFTHGGESIPEGCLLADKAGYSYVKHYVEGKETYSPGLGWLERVVYTSLIEFLRRQKTTMKPDFDLADLAAEAGIIMVKTKRAVQRGEVATDRNVDIQ